MSQNDLETSMHKSVESTQRMFNTIRTGRANSSLLDRISVEYYGADTPLKSLATLSTPDSQTVQIQPFDISALAAIEKAIAMSELGFTPNNDGTNDAFFIQGTDIDPDRFEFEIYNRWGEVIWETTDPSDAWYGQVGEEGQHYVPNGPYAYRVEVHSLEDESYRKEVFGVVMIIR